MSKTDRLTACWAWFRTELDSELISDLRKALDHGQPLGDSRFIDSIERATSHRREAQPRGKPRKLTAETGGAQEKLSLKNEPGPCYLALVTHYETF